MLTTQEQLTILKLARRLASVRVRTANYRAKSALTGDKRTARDANVKQAENDLLDFLKEAG